jgi:molecular chaperone GrpE
MSNMENNKKRSAESNSSDKELESKKTIENEKSLTEEKQTSAEEEKEIESSIENLQTQLSRTESLADTYKDQLLRLAAEFENFKKRVESDKMEFVKFSNEKIIKDLIPVLDDFERALSTGNQGSDADSFKKGVELIYQKLYKLLGDKGLKPIESVGKEFDVMYHDVLMQVPRSDVKPDTILDEVERGYTLHGKVIKHAKVIIASPVQDQSESERE